jgi:hypothetical protein
LPQQLEGFAVNKIIFPYLIQMPTADGWLPLAGARTRKHAQAIATALEAAEGKAFGTYRAIVASTGEVL